MGRWSYIVLGGTANGASLLIVTGYRRGPRSSVPGEKTAWSQQTTMLLKENRNIRPPEAFLTDLKEWIRKYRTPKMEILLSLDANENWTEQSAIKLFATDLGLCNINAECMLEATHPNITHVSRSTTIDFCLGSPAVLENIEYAASTPFDLETLGDHRGLMLDINVSKLLGATQIGEAQTARKLVLSNPKAVEKYLLTVDESFNKQNIYQRSRKLLKRVNQGQTDFASIMNQYEALDKEVLGICKKAEHGCRPTWSGNYDWSPKLVHAIKQIRYWRHRLRQNSETALIRNLGEELNIQYTDLTYVDIQQRVNASKKELRDVQQNSRRHRQDHLEELAQKYAAQNNMTQYQAVTELLSHEDVRSTFHTLRTHLKPLHRSQLKTLWVATDKAGNYIKDHEHKQIYSDAKQIHAQLLQRNEEHLTQASVTPFAKGNLKKKLKWDSTGVLTDDILSGDLLNQRRFGAAMQLYLESLRVQDLSRLNVVRPDILLEDYRQFWQKKRETTVTSPYGLHTGHYKAAVHKLAILNVHRILLLIPFKTGMVPTRWRRTVQTMLEKEPGAPWIHRLRIIELFDAQANAGFQIFIGRHLMGHANKHNLVQDESFGSTPGKMATSAVVQKVLAIDQL